MGIVESSNNTITHDFTVNPISQINTGKLYIGYDNTTDDTNIVDVEFNVKLTFNLSNSSYNDEILTKYKIISP